MTNQEQYDMLVFPCARDINVPATDAISRQAVLNILDDMVKDYIKENDFDKAQGVAWVKVQKLPSVQPQTKTGHWIDRGSAVRYSFWERYQCSECGGLNDNTKFCPHCGAKMAESEEV